jgi:hypothetical protein
MLWTAAIRLTRLVIGSLTGVFDEFLDIGAQRLRYALEDQQGRAPITDIRRPKKYSIAATSEWQYVAYPVLTRVLC